MAITSINIDQNNKVGTSNLLPVHSPLIFLIDVEYTGSPPERLDVEIYDDNNDLIVTYNAIPFADLLSTPVTRQFAFTADGIIRGLMDGFDDQFQLFDTFLPVEDITKIFKLRFVDPNNSAIYHEDTFTFVHGAKQFGENPNLENQYNNEADSYLAAKDSVVYVYFYNNNAANSVSVGQQLSEVFALDFDNLSIFTDYEDSNFTIDVAI